MPSKIRTKAQAEKNRQRHAAIERENSANAREIGSIPAVAAPDRREACRFDLERFCLTYLASTFTLPFSADHKKAIAKIERAVLNGDLLALAMPRGSGKSAMAKAGVAWALIYAHHRFVVAVGATMKLAQELIKQIKAILAANPIVLADFPEVCKPIWALEGDGRRAPGQTVDGEKTNIVFGKDQLVLPTITGSESSCSTVVALGLTGQIRGLTHTLPDGSSIRPTLALVDDPQTRRSARSLTQTETRLELLNGDIRGLAGPGKRLGCMVTCTVIAPGDLADQILDKKLNPHFHGERTRMMYSFPRNSILWERYAEIRADAMRAEETGEAATEFYRTNQSEMDAGAEVAWKERFEDGEISAIQNAMNKKIDDPDIFEAEYQNNPVVHKAAAALDAASIQNRLSGYERSVAGAACEKLTAFIDVGQGLLWWMVMGWSTNFDGQIIDYGCFPEQRQKIFKASGAGVTLEKIYPAAGRDGAIFAGLQAVTENILGRTWKRSDGAELAITRCMIDAGWATDVVPWIHREIGAA